MQFLTFQRNGYVDDVEVAELLTYIPEHITQIYLAHVPRQYVLVLMEREEGLKSTSFMSLTLAVAGNALTFYDQNKHQETVVPIEYPDAFLTTILACISAAFRTGAPMGEYTLNEDGTFLEYIRDEQERRADQTKAIYIDLNQAVGAIALNRRRIASTGVDLREGIKGAHIRWDLRNTDGIFAVLTIYIQIELKHKVTQQTINHVSATGTPYLAFTLRYIPDGELKSVPPGDGRDNFTVIPWSRDVQTADLTRTVLEFINEAVDHLENT